MMVTEMEGHGRQKGLHSDWPEGMRVDFLPKLKIEIVVENRHQKEVVKAIIDGPEPVRWRREDFYYRGERRYKDSYRRTGSEGRFHERHAKSNPKGF